MRLSVLPYLALMIGLLFFAKNASASSNLEISSTANFSQASTNFSGGQTIFIRIASDLPSMSESNLNLRDSQYKLINSFPLKKEGTYFSAVIATPYQSGYYSLEAIIKDRDSSSTSVKTIKIGNPSSANVKVNVNSSANGSEVLGENEGQIPEAAASPNATGLTQGNGSNDGGWEYSNNQSQGDVKQKSFGQYLTSMFQEIADFLWPF